MLKSINWEAIAAELRLMACEKHSQSVEVFVLEGKVDFSTPCCPEFHKEIVARYKLLFDRQISSMEMKTLKASRPKRKYGKRNR